MSHLLANVLRIAEQRAEKQGAIDSEIKRIQKRDYTSSHQLLMDHMNINQLKRQKQKAVQQAKNKASNLIKVGIMEASLSLIGR